MDNQPSSTTWWKKTIYYSFIPSNAEEEAVKATNTSRIKNHKLVETGTPLKFDTNNPWKIKRKITREVLDQENLVISYSKTVEYIRKYITSEHIIFGELRISFSATFKCILPFWKLELARSLVNGDVVRVNLWDVTERIDRPNKYEGGSFTFRKLHSDDDYSLLCRTLINDRGLGVGDKIWLCWDPTFSKFIFMLFSKVCRKKTFSYNFIRSKTEEEVNNTSWLVNRELKETGLIQIIDSNNLIRPMSEDIAFGELRISFLEMFEYILPYWKLELATSLVNGNVVRVGLWDVMEDNDTKKYDGASFTFRKLRNDDYSLSCERLINDRGLGIDDEIELYWDPRISRFMFKLISKVCVSRIRACIDSFVIRGM